MNDRPKILKYMMQLEVDMTIEQEYSIDTSEEIAVTKFGMLWQQDPVQIFETNLVEFIDYPPIKLKVNYTSQANVELTSTMNDEVHHTGDFSASGKIIISKNNINP